MISIGHSEWAAAIVEQMQRRQSKEVVRVEKSEIEKLPDGWNEWRQWVEAQIAALKGSQDYVQPRALMEIVERLENLEKARAEPIDITPDGGVSPDDIRHLQQSVEEVAIAALKSANVMVMRLDAIEARLANIKLEIVEDTLGELKNSRA